MQLLRQSTAATVVLGPFVDSADGVTAETGLTIAQADIRLSKNGAAFAQTNNAAGATHMENGYYSVPLDTTDTGTLGRLTVAVTEAGALPVWREFQVVPAHVYDGLVLGTDNLQVDAVQIEGGDATDAINAAADAALADYDAPTKAEMDAGFAALNDPTAGAIADAVWDEAKAGHVGAGSFGEEVQAHALSQEVTALNDFDPAAETVDVGAISGDATAADNLEAAFDGTGYDVGGLDVSELNQIVDDLINGGRLDLLIDAIKAKTDSLTFTQAGAVDANVTHVNETEVGGDGGEGTEWGPAA